MYACFVYDTSNFKLVYCVKLVICHTVLPSVACASVLVCCMQVCITCIYVWIVSKESYVMRDGCQPVACSDEISEIWLWATVAAQYKYPVLYSRTTVILCTVVLQYKESWFNCSSLCYILCTTVLQYRYKVCTLRSTRYSVPPYDIIIHVAHYLSSFYICNGVQGTSTSTGEREVVLRYA